MVTFPDLHPCGVSGCHTWVSPLLCLFLTLSCLPRPALPSSRLPIFYTLVLSVVAIPGFSPLLDRLFGLVVQASASRAGRSPGSNPTCAGIFSGSSHTSDLNIGTPVATLSGAWRYRASAGTGWPGVSILYWVRWKV